MVYLVDGMVVDKEVDDRAVKREVFEWVLLARKSVMGFNNYIGY